MCPHWQAGYLAGALAVGLLCGGVVEAQPYVDTTYSCPPLPNPDHRCQLCVFDHTLECPPEFRCGNPSFKVCPDGNCYPEDFECEIEYGHINDPCAGTCAESCAATVFKDSSPVRN